MPLDTVCPRGKSPPMAEPNPSNRPSPRDRHAEDVPVDVLVVGGEMLSKIDDWTDRGTCVLFGDGAGAVLVQPTHNGSIFSFGLGNGGRKQQSNQ